MVRYGHGRISGVKHALAENTPVRETRVVHVPQENTHQDQELGVGIVPMVRIQATRHLSASRARLAHIPVPPTINAIIALLVRTHQQDLVHVPPVHLEHILVPVRRDVHIVQLAIIRIQDQDTAHNVQLAHTVPLLDPDTVPPVLVVPTLVVLDQQHA